MTAVDVPAPAPFRAPAPGGGEREGDESVALRPIDRVSPDEHCWRLHEVTYDAGSVLEEYRCAACGAPTFR